ncbi:MAG: PaaI family thioesterase [Candidatus Hydrogenedentota bacterium]
MEDGLVKARLRPRSHHCGFKGVIHGGIVASILDETMGWAAAVAINRMCVTGEMTVRYIENAPDDRELICVTCVEKQNRLIVYTTGVLVDDEGTKYASATGKFTPLTEAKTLEVDNMLNYRGGEIRLFDELRAQAEQSE